MKKFLFIALLLICFSSFGQNNSDSLNKYSYAIIGLDKTQTLLGSGFFIKNNNSLYFITAKHCFVNCDSIGFINSDMIMVINRFNPDKSFAINTKPIKLKYPCHGTYFDSDYVAIPINIQMSKYVNSVENFVLPPFKKIDSASVFGFPGFSYSKVENGQVFIIPTKMKLPPKIHGFYIKTDKKNRVDSASCFFEVDSFLNDLDSLGGFSGSPIFIKSKDKIRILGVFYASSTNPNGKTGIWYAPIEFIESQIKTIN
jgi:V8-like Glu-specific endopeptidase